MTTLYTLNIGNATLIICQWSWRYKKEERSPGGLTIRHQRWLVVRQHAFPTEKSSPPPEMKLGVSRDKKRGNKIRG